MNAPHVAEASRDYLTQLVPPLVRHFDLLAGAPQGVARLRELILSLAVRGKLVPQDPADEPAGVLMERIRVQKDRLIAEGKIKRDKPLPAIDEDEEPFDLPEGWKWVPLQHVGYTQTGTTPDKKNPKLFGGLIPFIRPGDIFPGRVDYFNEGLSQDGVADSGRLAPAGSTLMVCIGTIGKCNLIERDCSFNQQINSITPLGGDPQFLLHCMRSSYFQLAAWEGSSSTTIAILNKGKWETIPVPVAPLAEQARIVAKVEELMALCDLLEAKGRLEAEQHRRLVATLFDSLTSAESAHELAESWQRIAAHFDLLLDRPEAVDVLEQTVLQLAVRGLLVPQDSADEPAHLLMRHIQAELDCLIAEGKFKRNKPLPFISEDEKPFELPKGWEWVRLNDLIKIQSGDGLTAAQMAKDGTVPVFGGNGVNGYHDKGNIVEPTIVIGRVGFYCGSIHITPATAWITDNAFITSYAKTHLSMNWLYWLLVGTNLKENEAATAQPVISGRKVYPIVVGLPPLSEQARIVARVEELRRLCADLRRRLIAARTVQGHLAGTLIETALETA